MTPSFPEWCIARPVPDLFVETLTLLPITGNSLTVVLLLEATLLDSPLYLTRSLQTTREHRVGHLPWLCASRVLDSAERLRQRQVFPLKSDEAVGLAFAELNSVGATVLIRWVIAHNPSGATLVLLELLVDLGDVFVCNLDNVSVCEHLLHCDPPSGLRHFPTTQLCS